MRAVYSTLHKGFTLVELVIVIIILSVLGMMTSSFIGTGVDIYTGIADRDKSLNSVRFVMERLRREASNALPNSATVSADKQCLTFTPIIASSIYGNNFPISPLSSKTATISAIDNYSFKKADQAVVYLLDVSELTDSSQNRVKTIKKFTGNNTLKFSSDISFALSSPAKRVYIIRDNISYYFSGDQIFRGTQCNDGVLMAEDITGSFNVEDATLQRNGLVQVTYKLNFDDVEVPIEQTLHISNVP